MSEIRAHTARVDGDKLREIAERPNHTVYEYTFDQPDKTLTPQEQVLLFGDMVVRFDGLCRAKPEASNEQLREMVLMSNVQLRDFQRLCPKVFASCCVRARTDDDRTYLDRVRKGVMVSLHERAEGTGDDGERQMRAMAMNMRLAMRPAREGDAAADCTVSLDSQAEAQGVDADSVKPLHPDELGESTVRQ